MFFSLFVPFRSVPFCSVLFSFDYFSLFHLPSILFCSNQFCLVLGKTSNFTCAESTCNANVVEKYSLFHFLICSFPISSDPLCSVLYYSVPF